MGRVFGESNQAMDWLVGKWQWPNACLLAGYAMLLVAPVWAFAAGTALALVYMQLPLYMVHQYEEHAGDRFRKYINQNIADCDALTPAATFWINAIGVWGLLLVAIYVAAFVDLSYGLVACYLPIVNALTHVREAVARREYNPGLLTSVTLFLPLGGWGLYEASAASGATWVDQVTGAGIAIAVHMAIIAYIVMRIRRLRSTGTVIPSPAR